MEATALVPAEKWRKALRGRILQTSFTPNIIPFLSQDITAGINFLQKTKVDWIVVIPKKHKLVDKLFKRSQTTDLLYHTTVPVLCIHEE